MEFIRLNSMMEGAQPLADRLIEELKAGKKVLWLVPGGSNIPLSIEVMKRIPEAMTDDLTVYLTDERYGEVEHPDSNSWQLEQAGFDPKKARVTYILARGLNLKETVDQYALSIGAAFEAADIVIGQFGMGADGHILGILPHSPAVTSPSLVVGYKTETFTRITLTARAVRQHVDAAYVYALGESKQPALVKLKSETVDVAEQPAQLLKALPEAYVYNDQIDN